MSDIVAVLQQLPAIITALGALVVAVRSSRTTKRAVKKLDTRMEGCEKIRIPAAETDELTYHERFAIAHLRAALDRRRIPDDMPDVGQQSRAPPAK